MSSGKEEQEGRVSGEGKGGATGMMRGGVIERRGDKRGRGRKDEREEGQDG